MGACFEYSGVCCTPIHEDNTGRLLFARYIVQLALSIGNLVTGKIIDSKYKITPILITYLHEVGPFYLVTAISFISLGIS